MGLIAAFVGIFLAGAAAPPPVTTIAQVLAALDRGDAQQARQLSDLALGREKDAPARARLLLYRGVAAELLGTHDGALRDLTQAIDTRLLSSEDMEQAYLQRGFLHEGLGQPDQAVRDYGSAIALQGYSTATAFNNRGNIYLRQGRLMDAQADYLAALAAEGGQSQYSYYGLGRVAEAMGDRLGARGFYAKAVAIDAGYAVASERLAALGSPSDAAVSNPPERIVLRPPAAGVRQTASESPIILRPPPQKKEPLPAVPPSPFLPVNTLVLRPALDQPDAHVGAHAGLGSEVQLGAWRSAAEASAAWDKARARADGALDGLSPHIQTAQIPGRGRYFRLRVRPEMGKSGAEMCAALAAKALACFPVRD